MYAVHCTLYSVPYTIYNTNTKNGMSILMLGVIHKKIPQGGGRGVKGKGTRADIGGRGVKQGWTSTKKFWRKLVKKHELMAKISNRTYNIQKWAN